MDPRRHDAGRLEKVRTLVKSEILDEQGRAHAKEVNGHAIMNT